MTTRTDAIVKAVADEAEKRRPILDSPDPPQAVAILVYLSRAGQARPGDVRAEVVAGPGGAAVIVPDDNLERADRDYADALERMDRHARRVDADMAAARRHAERELAAVDEQLRRSEEVGKMHMDVTMRLLRRNR